LVSIHSQWIDEFSKTQKSQEKHQLEVEYAKQGVLVCRREFREQVIRRKILGLRAELIPRLHCVDLKSLVASDTIRKSSTIVIDMDLQFVLVPQRWALDCLKLSYSKVHFQLREDYKSQVSS
jgi:hypothetical protein